LNFIVHNPNGIANRVHSSRREALAEARSFAQESRTDVQVREGNKTLTVSHGSPEILFSRSLTVYRWPDNTMAVQLSGSIAMYFGGPSGLGDYLEDSLQWNGWPAEDAKKILSMLKIQFDKGSDFHYLYTRRGRTPITNLTAKRTKMSVYEKLHGTISVNRKDASAIFDAAIARFDEDDVHFYNADRINISKKEVSVMIQCTDEADCLVTVHIDENNHAIDYAQKGKLFPWIMGQLRGAPSAKGTLFSSNEHDRHDQLWAKFGGQQ